jgi:hypothetical protein
MVHIYRYNVTVQYMYTVCSDQIRIIGISVNSDTHHFFVLGTSKIFLRSSFKAFNSLLSIIVILLCCSFSYPAGHLYPLSFSHPSLLYNLLRFWYHYFILYFCEK